VASTRVRAGVTGTIVAGLLVALALAAFASPFASTEPDGLNQVAADHRFDSSARESATARSPLAHYSVRHIDDERTTKGLAGIIGVMITLVVAAVVFGGLWLVVRRRSGPATARSQKNPMGAG
jgi:cobalt/nickel transport system permease protein